MDKIAGGAIAARGLPPMLLKPAARSVAAIAVVSLLLSLSSAFGTGVVPLLPRTVFWLSLLAAARVTAMAAGAVVRAGTRSWPLWASTGAYLIVAPLAITLSLSVETCLVFRTALQGDHFLGLLAPVFVVTAFMRMVFGLLDKVPFESHVREAEAPAGPVALAARLPAHLIAADIHAISAQDHYLRVHTSLGDALILSSFAQALRDLDGIEGTQTHRSHWVARAAIVGIEKSRAHLAFRLRSGLTIPVSRTYQKALRANGWFTIAGRSSQTGS